MSDVMLLGVLRMPYMLAMKTEFSRLQFQARAAEAADRIEADAAEIERLRASLTDTLYFLERHSNRWDGVNGKPPFEVVETARALLGHNTQISGACVR